MRNRAGLTSAVYLCFWRAASPTAEAAGHARVARGSRLDRESTAPCARNRERRARWECWLVMQARTASRCELRGDGFVLPARGHREQKERAFPRLLSPRLRARSRFSESAGKSGAAAAGRILFLRRDLISIVPPARAGRGEL